MESNCQVYPEPEQNRILEEICVWSELKYPNVESMVQDAEDDWQIQSTTSTQISHNNDTTSDPHIVAELFSQHFECVSSSHNYSPDFLRMRPTLEAIRLNFTPDIEHYYNSPITMREVLGTLKQRRNTAPGEDGIRYEMLQHLNITALEYMLTLFNMIGVVMSIPTNGGGQ